MSLGTVSSTTRTPLSRTALADHVFTRTKFNDSSPHPESSSLSYHDTSQSINLQSVNGARSIAYNGACVRFAGDALLNRNPRICLHIRGLRTFSTGDRDRKLFPHCRWTTRIPISEEFSPDIWVRVHSPARILAIRERAPRGPFFPFHSQIASDDPGAGFTPGVLELESGSNPQLFELDPIPRTAHGSPPNTAASSLATANPNTICPRSPYSTPRPSCAHCSKELPTF
jgi:hypothetical protein